jgi:uncharacterized phage-associated protein
MDKMPSNINFKPKAKKIIETILYLTHKVRDLSDYKCAKLIYLADKEHLNRYHRPITFDYFVAMKRGPVPSVAYDLIKNDRITLKKYNLDDEPLPFTATKTDPTTGYQISDPARPVNKKELSESDFQVLDEIIAEHAHKSDRELYNLTHSHIAYSKAWGNKKGIKNKKMLFEDMIEDSVNKEDLIETLKYIAPAIS